MALTYDTITAITNELYLPKFRQHFADRNLCASMIWKQGTKAQGGERIKQHLMYKYNQGGWYSETEQHTIDREEKITAAYWDWKQLEIPLVMTGLDRLRNAGPAQVKSLMEKLMWGAQIRAGQLLAQAVFYIEHGAATLGTDSGKVINSLDHLCDDTSGTLTGSGNTTYGGIDKGTYTWWGGNTFDIGATGVNPTLTYGLLNRLLSKAHDGDIYPNLVCMGKSAYADLLSDLEGRARYLDRKAMAGFEGVEINGVKVVADRYITETDGGTETPANRVYALNTDFIDLVSHRDDNMRLEPFAKPIYQNVWVGHIYFTGGLTSDDPSRQAVGYNYAIT